MPTASDQLTASYLANQAHLADKASTLVLAYWARSMMAQDGSIVADIRAAADRWLALAVPVILNARLQSAVQGQAFYKVRRRLELPDEPTFRTPAPERGNREQVTTSLWVTGPMRYVDKGESVETILSEERLNAIKGASIIRVGDGGRAAIETAYEADPLATGYYRVEDGDPCYFCAALLSRGTVFKEDSFDASDDRFFGPGEAKVHDHCGGSLVASYTTDPYPGDTAKYRDLWYGDWKPKPGDPDMMTGFRRFYEGQREA